jgi:hypothetical protein
MEAARCECGGYPSGIQKAVSLFGRGAIQDSPKFMHYLTAACFVNCMQTYLIELSYGHTPP